MSGIYQNILDTVGNTPIVRINKLGPDDVNIDAGIRNGLGHGGQGAGTGEQTRLVATQAV